MRIVCLCLLLIVSGCDTTTGFILGAATASAAYFKLKH